MSLNSRIKDDVRALFQRDEKPLLLVFSAFLKAFNFILAFSISVILARQLGADNYGIYSVTLSVVGFLSLCSYLGLPALITRYTATYDQANHWQKIRGLLTFSLTYVLASSLICCVLGFLISQPEFLLSEKKSQTVLLSLPLVPLTALFAVVCATLVGLRKILIGTAIETLGRSGIFIILILLVISTTNGGIENIILAQIGATGLALLAGFITILKATWPTRRQPRTYEYQAWKTSMLPFSGIAIVSFINIELIALFLGLTNQSHEMAIYRVAFALGMVVLMPLTVLESLTSPFVTRYYKKHQNDQIQNIARLVSLVCLVCSLLAGLVLIVMGKQILTIFFGIEYIHAYPPMIVIVLGNIFVSYIGLSMQLLHATEYESVAYKITSYSSIFTIALCCSIIPFWGAIGAALTLSVSKSIRALVFAYEARKRLNIKTSMFW